MVMKHKELKGKKVQEYLVDVKEVINNKIIRHLKENDIDELIILCKKHALYEKSDFTLSNQKKNLTTTYISRCTYTYIV